MPSGTGPHAIASTSPLESTRPDDFVEQIASAPDGPDSLLGRFLAEESVERSTAFWLLYRSPGWSPEDATDLILQVERDIAAIDERLGEQVDAILHHESLQALEASWRGLMGLVGGVPDGANIKVRVLSASWRELSRDRERTIEFDQGSLFRKVYTEEFDMPGGEPFSVLVGDYEFHHRPGQLSGSDPIETLASISQVAAAAFAPFICGAHPTLFGLDHFTGLERSLDLERCFSQPEHLKWRQLRSTEDARFVSLTVPRVLRREPYDDDAQGFPYREDVSGPGNGKYLWGTATYDLASLLIRSFARFGWLDDIRGTERGSDSGGLVSGLPAPSFATDSPGVAPKPSTDTIIDEELDRELGAVGFLPLCHCPDTTFSAFHRACSIQEPATYDRPAATANARISAQLPVILNVSRFAHYLKVIARDKIGAFIEPHDLEAILRRWLLRYISSNDDLGPELRARYPLREAGVEVRSRPDRPGSYLCVVHLRTRPHFDEASASLFLTTNLATEWKSPSVN